MLPWASSEGAGATSNRDALLQQAPLRRGFSFIASSFGARAQTTSEPSKVLQNQECISLDNKSLDNSCLGINIDGVSSTETATRKEIYDLKSDDPKRSIGGLLGRVKIAMVAALDAELAPLEITAAQLRRFRLGI